MRMFSRRAVGYLVVATSLALTTGPSLAQTQGQEVTIRDAKQLVGSLRSGGYVIVVRHGATFSDQADTDPFNFDNITKQRNLNEKGKELAKAFGDAIRQVGIPAGKVYTSNFNRACKWRTGQSSLPSSRGALTEAARQRHEPAFLMTPAQHRGVGVAVLYRHLSP